MKSELIVDVQQSEVSIALLEDSRLVSLQKEARTATGHSRILPKSIRRGTRANR